VIHHRYYLVVIVNVVDHCSLLVEICLLVRMNTLLATTTTPTTPITTTTTTITTTTTTITTTIIDSTQNHSGAIITGTLSQYTLQIRPRLGASGKLNLTITITDGVGMVVMPIYTHTYIHTNIHTYIHTNIHTYVNH